MKIDKFSWFQKSISFIPIPPRTPLKLAQKFNYEARAGTQKVSTWELKKWQPGTLTLFESPSWHFLSTFLIDLLVDTFWVPCRPFLSTHIDTFWVRTLASELNFRAKFWGIRGGTGKMRYYSEIRRTYYTTYLMFWGLVGSLWGVNHQNPALYCHMCLLECLSK